MTQPIGPPCDLCKEEPAVMSVMNLADHEQLLVGPACLLPYFQGMVGMLSGAPEDAEAPGSEATEPPAGESAVPPAGGPEAQAGTPGAGRPARSRSRAGKT